MRPFKDREFTKKKLKFYDRLIRDRRLKGMAACVAWRIVDRIDRKKDYSFPPLVKIAAELDCNEKTVRRAINALEKCGWFDIHRGRGVANPHKYWANWDNRTDLSTLGQKETKTGQLSPLKPDRPVQKNRTKVSNKPSKEPFKEPIGGDDLSLKGEIAPNGKDEPMTKVNASPEDLSPVGRPDCLHGKKGAKKEAEEVSSENLNSLMVEELQGAGFTEQQAWQAVIEQGRPDERVAS